MCVAAIIFKPVSREYLDCMDHDNPDGAGVAWEEGGTIRFVRGLDATKIHALQEDGTIKYPYLLHFRWATHGGKLPELTHPFPLGPRALMGELSGSCEALLIHNGTWNSYDKAAQHILRRGNYEMPEELLNAMSDTAVAAWLAQDHPEILDQVMWATAVAEMKTSPDGVLSMEVTTRGTWSDHEGNWYSNLNWLPWSGYSSYTGHSSRDTEWMNSWNKWYFNEDTGKKHDDDVPATDPYKGVNWDAYFLDPYSTRADEYRPLTFEQYVERFKPGAHQVKADPAPAAGASGGTDGAFSWNDYLQERYGESRVSDESLDALAEGGIGTDKWPSAFKLDRDAGTLNIDPDLISEDFETVNEVLGRLSDREKLAAWGR